MKTEVTTWQFFVDPVCPDLAQYIAQTASDHSALKTDAEEVSLTYGKRQFPVYRVQQGFLTLLYEGRKKYFGNYGHHLRFFKREGEYGPLHMINYQELKSAANRAVNKAIRIVIGNKKTVSNHS
jgi:hypothetical protein